MIRRKEHLKVLDKERWNIYNRQNLSQKKFSCRRSLASPKERSNSWHFLIGKRVTSETFRLRSRRLFRHFSRTKATIRGRVGLTVNGDTHNWSMTIKRVRLFRLEPPNNNVFTTCRRRSVRPNGATSVDRRGRLSRA